MQGMAHILGIEVHVREIQRQVIRGDHFDSDSFLASLD